MALQNLAVTVNGLKESVNLQEAKVATISSKNIHAASKYHSRFGQLLYKYSVFANQYKLELENLQKSLLNDISAKKEEQEREFQQKLELLSNKSSHSNLEIDENVEANSVNMTNVSLSSLYSAPNKEDSECETSQNTVSMNIPIDAISAEPQPMKSKKSIPISQSKQAVAPKGQYQYKNNKKNNNKKSNGRNNKNNKKNTKSMNKPAAIPKTKAKRTRASKPVSQRKDEQKNDEQDKYVYDANRVQFNLKFDAYDKDSGEWLSFNKKEYKHSTLVYIGNIPVNIKVAAVQFFVMKKFKVSMRQIDETKVQKVYSGLSQYALVRFRSDVPHDHITKYMDILNSENARIKEEKVAAKDAMNMMTKKKKDKDGKKDDNKKNKKQGKTSWQYRVFANYSKPEYHYSYYENEHEMYNDESRRHELFIRNFDILDKKCHKQLTDKLLPFGDLYRDIEIKVDVFGDPYAIAVFKYINDAVYCCNSDIYFGGKRLDIRYSRN